MVIRATSCSVVSISRGAMKVTANCNRDIERPRRALFCVVRRTRTYNKIADRPADTEPTSYIILLESAESAGIQVRLLQYT